MHKNCAEMRRKMDRKGYMTTGEFANLMNVTKDTLFHYDRIGLFSPEIKKENGYRYYGTQQLEELNTILLLRELDIPLEEIKKFLDIRKPEKLLQLFDMEEELIFEQMRKLKERQKWIHRQRERLKMLETVDFSCIYKRYFPKRYYCMQSVSGSAPQAFTQSINSLIEAYHTCNFNMCFDISYIQFEQDIKNHIYHNYKNVALLMYQKPKGMNASILEEGEYLLAYHMGHWETIGLTYQRLLEYADKEKISLESLFIEYYVVDYLTSKSEENFVTEICVKVSENKC